MRQSLLTMFANGARFCVFGRSSKAFRLKKGDVTATLPEFLRGTSVFQRHQDVIGLFPSLFQERVFVETDPSFRVDVSSTELRQRQGRTFV